VSPYLGFTCGQSVGGASEKGGDVIDEESGPGREEPSLPAPLLSLSALLLLRQLMGHHTRAALEHRTLKL
jgi:hypothetical protein